MRLFFYTQNTGAYRKLDFWKSYHVHMAHVNPGSAYISSKAELVLSLHIYACAELLWLYIVRDNLCGGNLYNSELWPHLASDCIHPIAYLYNVAGNL
jgi:hypothetical protein